MCTGCFASCIYSMAIHSWKYIKNGIDDATKKKRQKRKWRKRNFERFIDCNKFNFMSLANECFKSVIRNQQIYMQSHSCEHLCVHASNWALTLHHFRFFFLQTVQGTVAGKLLRIIFFYHKLLTFRHPNITIRAYLKMCMKVKKTRHLFVGCIPTTICFHT